MLNMRQSDIIDRQTFDDEFETVVSNENQVNTEVSYANSEHSSRIRDNFDRIIHYDKYQKQEQITDRNSTYQKFTTAVNTDIQPSMSTMQFRGVPKSEIYRDLKVEEQSYEKTVKPRSKSVAITFMAVVLLLLSALIIFNTALLNNMNALITAKNEQIVALNQTKASYQQRLDDVSSDETIIDAARDLGMVGR